VALLLLLVAGLAFMVLSPAVAEHLLFYPDRSDPGAPPRLAGVRGEQVELEARDGAELYGWWYAPDDPVGVLLLLHGNAGHLGDRAHVAEGLVRRRLAVFLLEYRGYGGNPGTPTIRGVVRDAEAGLEEVAKRAGGREEVVLMGRSLGGAVGIAALGRDTRVGGVVLESTFTSLEEIAATVYPWLPRLLFRRLRGLLDTRRGGEGLDAPLLVVHGTEDALIPASMGRELVRAAPGPAEWYPVPGAGHNEVPAVAGAAYFERIARFVD